MRSYTVINHEAKEGLGLTLSEYCLADMIHHLATNPSNQFPGWCWASRRHLAKELGISERLVYMALKKLDQLDLIEMNEKAMIRATPLWYEATKTAKSADSMQNQQLPTAKSAEDGLQKVQTTIREKNNKRDIDKVFAFYKLHINENSRLTKSSKDKIRTRLKEFSVIELEKAIRNFSEDHWQMKHNASRGIAWFFRSEDSIDRYINLTPRKSGIVKIS